MAQIDEAQAAGEITNTEQAMSMAAKILDRLNARQ
jgi:hypothetical protein